MTKYYVQADDQTLEMDFAEQGDLLRVSLDEREMLVDLRQISGSSLFSLIIDNESHEVLVEQREDGYDVLIAGELYRLNVQDEWARRLANIQRRSRLPDGELPIKAPMPGIVLSIEVSSGDRVKQGQGLIVLGAMKMENQIKAPRAGTVKSIDVESGQTVEQAKVLMILA